MDSNKFRSVREILKSRINTPLVWGVLLMTFALTVLFYFSQKQQLDLYGRYIATLSDYKFFEVRAMQKLEKIRVFPERDPSGLMSSLRGLRETAVSLYASSEKDRSICWMPPEQDFAHFENAVLRWVASVKRYVPARTAWLESADTLSRTLFRLKSPAAERLFETLDSARMGFPVTLDSAQTGEISCEVVEEMQTLLLKNAELAAVWNVIDNDVSLIACENLMQAFKMQSLENRESRFWIQQVFYLTSIVLLLFTLFFVIRSRK